MSTSKQIKKLYYSKLKIKQCWEIRKKSKDKNIYDLQSSNLEKNYTGKVFPDEKLIYCDDYSNEEQFEKISNDAMLEMLSIDPEYFYQLKNFQKSL